MAIDTNLYQNVNLSDSQREQLDSSIRELPGNIRTIGQSARAFFNENLNTHLSIIQSSLSQASNGASSTAEYIGRADLLQPTTMGIPGVNLPTLDINGLNLGGLGMAAGKIADSVGQMAKDITSNIPGMSQIRSTVSGLFGGLTKNLNPTAKFFGLGGTSTESQPDWRVKITIPKETGILPTDSGSGEFHLLTPIANTGGVVFPYLPQIEMMYRANYSQQKLTHSNYTTHTYDSSEITDIRITADFSAQNQYEGRYMYAVMHFFRTITKMYYGKDETKPPSGNPPPIVFLDGYGYYHFPSIPCVVTQFSYGMPTDVDFLEVRLGNGQSVHVPTHNQMTILLLPVYSRARIYNDSNLIDFASGKLLANKRGMI